MKKGLRLAALAVAVGATAWWLVAGRNRGWTKTSVPVKKMDEVLGIEGITYEKRFVPGLDFLGITLAGAGALAGSSLLFRTRNITNTKPNPK